MKFTETHEWLKLAGAVATVGITDHAQKEISDVVFVDLPKVGRSLKKGEAAMVIESVKAAFDIYAPVSGTVTKVNDRLKDAPELVNRSPHEEGWLFELKIDDPAQVETLLTQEQYERSRQNARH